MLLELNFLPLAAKSADSLYILVCVSLEKSGLLKLRPWAYMINEKASNTTFTLQKRLLASSV